MTVERRYVPPSSLYLDQNPLLFFTLRSIDFEPLIGRTVDQKLEMMLANADKPSSRIIDDCDLNRLFGIIR